MSQNNCTNIFKGTNTSDKNGCPQNMVCCVAQAEETEPQYETELKNKLTTINSSINIKEGRNGPQQVMDSWINYLVAKGGNGALTAPNVYMINFLAQLNNNNNYKITSLADYAGHEEGSSHYKGSAVDFSCGDSQTPTECNKTRDNLNLLAQSKPCKNRR